MQATPKFSGSKIRQARHASGLTQAALATAAGTRERNIVRWENDQHEPRLDHIAAIARVTGRDVDFFFAAESADGSGDDEEEDSSVSFGDAMQALFDRAVDRALTQRLQAVQR